MPHNRIDPENQIVRAAILPDLAVHPRAQPELLGVRHGGGARDDRADGAEVVEGLGVAVLRAGHLGPLPVTRGEVVADGDAEDGVERGGVGGDVLGILADHDGELAFVVEFFGDGVDVDVLVGAGEGVWVVVN